MVEVACKCCEFRQHIIDRNLWIHTGHRNNIQRWNQCSIGGDNIDIGLFESTIEPGIMFDRPLKCVGKSMNTSTFNAKPDGVLWFSRGKWLYDPYCESRGNHEEHDISNIIGARVFVIDMDMTNILQVNTAEKLDSFCDKYGYSNGYSNEFFKFMGLSINWDAIRDEGYQGVSFGFCKVHELGLDALGPKYMWHLGFDVESLCVWDLGAIKMVYPVELVD